MKFRYGAAFSAALFLSVVHPTGTAFAQQGPGGQTPCVERGCFCDKITFESRPECYNEPESCCTKPVKHNVISSFSGGSPSDCAVPCEGNPKGGEQDRKAYESCTVAKEALCGASTVTWGCKNPPHGEAAFCFQPGLTQLDKEGCMAKSGAKPTNCQPVGDDGKWSCTVETNGCRVFSNKNTTCPGGYDFKPFLASKSKSLFGVEGFCFAQTPSDTNEIQWCDNEKKHPAVNGKCGGFDDADKNKIH